MNYKDNPIYKEHEKFSAIVGVLSINTPIPPVCKMWKSLVIIPTTAESPTTAKKVTGIIPSDGKTRHLL